jgi:hypothetical protein
VERYGYRLRCVVVGCVVAAGATRRIAHAGTEVMKRPKDVSVAPEEAGNQYSKKYHDDGDNTHQCQHLAPIIGVERRPPAGCHTAQR